MWRSYEPPRRTVLPLHSFTNKRRQGALLQDRTPIFLVGTTTDGRIAESPPTWPSLCIEELVPVP